MGYTTEYLDNRTNAQKPPPINGWPWQPSMFKIAKHSPQRYYNHWYWPDCDVLGSKPTIAVINILFSIPNNTYVNPACIPTESELRIKIPAGMSGCNVQVGHIRPYGKDGMEFKITWPTGRVNAYGERTFRTIGKIPYNAILELDLEFFYHGPSSLSSNDFKMKSYSFSTPRVKPSTAGACNVTDPYGAGVNIIDNPGGMFDVIHGRHSHVLNAQKQ